MKVIDYLKLDRYSNDYARYPVICADGFTISIQHSNVHHCSKEDNNFNFLELGYPSRVCGSLMEYAENSDDPLETIYTYVPLELIEEIVKSHGGIIGYGWLFKPTIWVIKEEN